MIPRRVSAYNLDQLLPGSGPNLARALVGTLGTCAIVLEATVRLVASPPARALLLLGYPEWPTPLTTCPGCSSSPRSPGRVSMTWATGLA